MKYDLWIPILFWDLEEVVNGVKTVDSNGSTKLYDSKNNENKHDA
jgi:hypothetical protein